MKPAEILAWAQLGAQLITVLGVPIAKVIELARSQNVGDAEIAQLEQLWGNLVTTIEQRIATLKPTVS